MDMDMDMDMDRVTLTSPPWRAAERRPLWFAA